MEEKRIKDRRLGSDRRLFISVVDNRYYEKRRILKVKIIMSTKQAYVGEFHLPEAKRGLSDAMNDEKSFINLTDVRIDDFSEVIPSISLNKERIVSVEEISSRKALSLEEGKAVA